MNPAKEVVPGATSWWFTQRPAAWQWVNAKEQDSVYGETGAGIAPWGER